MSQTSSKRRQSGYTMLELVMVISIVAILASIAIPSFQYVTSSNRVATEVNSLLGDVLFGRSEAVKEGQTVTVCSSTDGLTCSGSSHWEHGWIVFLDTNGDHAVQAGEAVIRSQPAFTSTDTFISGVAGVATLTYLTFNRLGYAPTGATTPTNVSLHDATSNTNWTRCLAVNPIGGAVTERYNFGTPPCT
jgi:type IV fimbrial biogenesis protein FimT